MSSILELAPYILPTVLVLFALSPPGRRLLQASPRRRWSLILASGITVVIVFFPIWSYGGVNLHRAGLSWCMSHPNLEGCPPALGNPTEVIPFTDAVVGEAAIQLRLPPPLRTCYSDNPAVCDFVYLWLADDDWQGYLQGWELGFILAGICMGLMAFFTRDRRKKKNVEAIAVPPPNDEAGP